MPWVKGQSGNAGGGKQKSRTISSGIIAELTNRYGTLENGARVIGAALVAIALDKNHPKQLTALSEVSDRLEGKPMQAVEVTTNHEQSLKELIDG